MVWYLRKAPTPSVLLPALKEVRPTTMLTVPLIMEKVYFNKVAPTFHKNKVVAPLSYSAFPQAAQQGGRKEDI
jgi:long-chain acyl-CoA synthetase